MQISPYTPPASPLPGWLSLPSQTPAWQTQLGTQTIDPTQATPAAAAAPATLSQALTGTPSGPASAAAPSPLTIGPATTVNDSLAKALLAEGNSGQPIESPLALLGRLAEVWSGDRSEKADQKQQATLDQNRRDQIAAAVEAAGSDPNALLKIAIQSGDSSLESLANQRLTAEHWTDLTPDQKIAAGYDPKIPVQVNSITGEKRIVSSSLNVPYYGAPSSGTTTTAATGAGGAAVPDGTTAPAGTPAAPASTSRYITNPDGTQTDRATGKTVALPLGLSPTAGAAPISPTDADYTTKAVAGGLTQAAVDQQALNYLATGGHPPIGRTGIAGEQGLAISNRMAAIGGNPALNKADYKALGSSLTQQTEYLNTVQRAFSTANTTLQSVLDWMNTNGINPSQFPDWNSLTNFASVHGLDVGPVSGFRSQIAQLRAEYAQVLARGGQQTDTVRTEANDIVPDNIAPADLATLAGRLKVDSQNAIEAATQQVAQIHQQLTGIVPTAASGAPQAAPSGTGAPLAAASGVPAAAAGPPAGYPDAKQAPDGNWYVPNPAGGYFMVKP